MLFIQYTAAGCLTLCPKYHHETLSFQTPTVKRPEFLLIDSALLLEEVGIAKASGADTALCIDFQHSVVQIHFVKGRGKNQLDQDAQKSFFLETELDTFGLC